MDPTIPDAPARGWLARYWRLRDAVGACWGVVRLARASLGVGLVAALLVAVPAQSREGAAQSPGVSL